MRRVAILAVVWWACGCDAVSPETECFGATDLPGEDDIQDNLVSDEPFPPPGYEYNERPQTEEEAEQSMRGALRARFAGSSRKVMCLIEEAAVDCKETAIWSEETGWNEARAFACVWDHPEASRVPEAGRTEFFLADDPVK